jgi:hypothetical protein
MLASLPGCAIRFCFCEKVSSHTKVFFFSILCTAYSTKRRNHLRLYKTRFIYTLMPSMHQGQSLCNCDLLYFLLTLRKRRNHLRLYRTRFIYTLMPSRHQDKASQPRSYFIFLLTLRKRRNHLRLYKTRFIYTLMPSRHQGQSLCNRVLTLFFCFLSGRDAIICVFTRLPSYIL